MSAIVAIVGRPNVGKSTLFNRILGRRQALVEDFPGVTRDRNYALVTRFERPFTLIDTGGFEPASEDRLLGQMREQSQLAIEEADVILCLFDGREGLTPADREMATMLRQVAKPVLFVVNKVDGPAQEAAASDFFALGIDEFVTVSAEHGLGITDLMERLFEVVPETPLPRIADDETRLAIIGRPNVGKSSLVNRLLGYERMVANPVAGTTRDSIDTPFTYNRRRYVLVDTAGIRRKGRVAQKMEKYTVIQALKALDRADIALVVLDGREGVTEQDLTVAGYAFERGRAVVLVVNKWDLVPKDHTTAGQYVKQLREAFKFIPEVPIHLVSALTGLRVSKIMADVEKVSDDYRRTIKTAELNKVLTGAQGAHQPPVFQGKRLRFFYMTQTGTRPPSFILFVNRAEGVHFSYRRYLTNCLRQAFGFAGCPIRLHFEDRQR